MTRPSTPPILSELRSPSSPAKQVAALRALKNEIIGHEQKKEMWIGLGVVTYITRILKTHRSTSKRRHRESDDNISANRGPLGSDEEVARLQAVIMVGSLAQGGPAYIQPLQAGQIFPHLLPMLCLDESSPVMVLATLRALNTAAESVALEYPRGSASDDDFLQTLYNDGHLANLARVLSQSSTSLVVQQQIALAAALVSKTCSNEFHRKQLADCGVLDALSTRLASFVVACAASGPSYGSGPANTSDIPPATSKSRLAPILHAIACIITDSKTRTSQFVRSPAFAAIFSRSDGEPYQWRVSLAKGFKQQGINNSAETSFPSWGRTSPAHSPSLHSMSSQGHRTKQPRIGRGYSTALEVTPTEVFNGKEDDETPLIGWLLEILKVESGVTRLMAIWVVSLLYHSGLASQRREKSMSMLLVPILVRMLEQDSELSFDEAPSYDMSSLHNPSWLIKQTTPFVLALLVMESRELQKAASDAGVIKRLSQLLKQSYDPLPSSELTKVWRPTPGSESIASRDAIGISKLGMPGLQPMVHHTFQVREAVLMALGAMATFKDEYRKAIIDNGVLPFVIDSLKPFGAGLAGEVANTSEQKNTKSGNPTSVLLAACRIAQTLSRSVGTLRTDLVDAGLASPLYTLIQYSGIDVQIAATSVVCNIVLEFSPMRELKAILETGILKVLCEHARSANAKLRLNSIWSLKHLVHSAPNSLKISCLQELGSDWLKQIICNDAGDHSSLGYRQHTEGMSTPIAMGTPNAAGEQVDLLNAMDDESQGSMYNQVEDEDDEVNMIDSIGALSKPEPRHRHTRSASQTFSRRTVPDRQLKAAAYGNEAELAAQARRDDLAVQEQGLDFIRNLICGPGASEMIDCLLNEMGQDKFFDILANLLRPKALDVFGRDRRASGAGVKHVQPQTEIIVAVCFIIVHLAAGLPRHRQLLISQLELLKLVVPLFTHAHSEIRVCCVWMVINLTWTDDQSDKLQSKSRAFELSRLGILEQLRKLEGDTELDVRERTKAAISQMNELLR